METVAIAEIIKLRNKICDELVQNSETVKIIIKLTFYKNR